MYKSYLHPPLHELLIRDKLIVVSPPASMANLLDQPGPDSVAQGAVDRLMGLSKADDEVGVEEEKQALQQLGTPPHLFLTLA